MKEVLSFNFYHLTILLAIIAVSSANENCSYNTFLNDCGRGNQINDTSEQYLIRSKIYEKRCSQNMQHNQDASKEYTAGIYCNSTDATDEELAERFGLKTIKVDDLVRTAYSPVQTQPGKVAAPAVLPTSYNYVTLGYVTSVKNQGSCGCCWSFASIAMYQSLLLKRGFSFGLSEQASLECTSYYSPNNRKSDCSGGYFSDPLTFLGKVGAVLRNNYPYISGSYGSGAGYPNTPGICAQPSRIMIGSGTAALYGPLTQTQIKTMLIDYGPVMIGVFANVAFTQYSSGVFTGCPSDAGNFINHAVLLVGYDDSTSSWLVKNQWDSSWGESGYIRISYSKDCGLSTLIGNVDFTNYNTDPRVTITDSSLLFSNSKWQSGTLLALALSLFVLAVLLQ